MEKAEEAEEGEEGEEGEEAEEYRKELRLSVSPEADGALLPEDCLLALEHSALDVGGVGRPWRQL